MLQITLRQAIGFLPPPSKGEGQLEEGRVFCLHFFRDKRRWCATAFDGHSTFYGFIAVADSPAINWRTFCMSDVRGASVTGDTIDIRTQALL
ncbi:MAG: hypothetical protein Q8R28_00835, partial [Dehalococcoidia bacterium]|nr:hypothetical protein [Dehalococcoidia bacterium]